MRGHGDRRIGDGNPLSGGTIAGGGSCTVTVNVTGTAEGLYHNSVSVSAVNGGTGNTSQATLSVATPPNLSKSFGTVSIGASSSTALTFTLFNSNSSVTLTGLQFVDTLPAGLVVATPHVVTGSCGAGTITASGNTISLSNGNLAPRASCTFAVNVTADGTKLGCSTNTTSTLASNEAPAGAAASANIFASDPFQVS